MGTDSAGRDDGRRGRLRRDDWHGDAAGRSRSSRARRGEKWGKCDDRQGAENDAKRL